MRGATFLRVPTTLELLRFQSTRPIRGATYNIVVDGITAEFQSTRPMRGATPRSRRRRPPRKAFQSTRPMRGATVAISHPPHLPADFNPRAPCGARRPALRRRRRWKHFNPRAPCGARPPTADEIAAAIEISIHAPHAGRDPGRHAPPRPLEIFQSTRPMRGATAKLHNFPVQFCARVTINTMPQTICRQNMPAASFKLQEHTRISGAKPPEKVCQLALRIQTISTPSGS